MLSLWIQIRSFCYTPRFKTVCLFRTAYTRKNVHVPIMRGILLYTYLLIYSYSDNQTIHTFSHFTALRISQEISYLDIPQKMLGS